MTEILNICDSCNFDEGGLSPHRFTSPAASRLALLGWEENSQEILRCARGWLGTPFKHQGRVRGVGCDCLGLLIGVARELNLRDAEGRLIAMQDDRRYGHYPDTMRLRQRLGEALTETDQPVPGSIGLFRIDGVAQHLGIFGHCRELTLIHAYAPARKVVEHRFSEEWKERLIGTYAVRSVVRE